DHNWKSQENLIRTLIDIASKGGNYLLNVGPTSEGEIPPESVERLAAMGKWLKTNGESIYATSASPFGKLDFGRATQSDGKIFLHVFDWPKHHKLNVPLRGEVKKAYLLSDPGTSLTAKGSDKGLTIDLPDSAPDKIASVVALEIDGKPDVIAPATKAAAAEAKA